LGECGLLHLAHSYELRQGHGRSRHLRGEAPRRHARRGQGPAAAAGARAPGAERLLNAGGWLEFWGGSHRIYVNQRHLEAHYARIGADVRRLIGDRRPVLLDYGCGDAFAAPEIARSASRLLLYDAAPAVRKRLAARYAGVGGIETLDDAAWEGLPPASLDMMLVNSVVQYLSGGELDALLRRARALLKPGGELILADVIPPDSGALDDIGSLLGSAARHGYLLAALGGLGAAFFSDYRRLRRDLGLARHAEAEMLGLLRAHGFAAERAPWNVGFSAKRMTFRAAAPQP
jgi:SAM-dependent methyltransferase